MGKYRDLAEQVGHLVDEKNAAYGASFEQAGDFLKLLYPNGIPVDAYTDALCIVRIFDKLKRLGNSSNLPANEGKIDAWKDIVGYGLLGLHKDSPVEPYTATTDNAAEARETSFEEKKVEEQGYYKLNTVMQDRAKAEHQERQKEMIRKMIEDGQKAAQQKLQAAVSENTPVPSQPATSAPAPAASPAAVEVQEVQESSKKKESPEENLIRTNCRLCGLEIDQLVSEKEVKEGKIIVHNDCYSKWQREKKLKETQTSKS